MFCVLQKGERKPSSEMGEAYYLIGVCYLEQCSFLLALDAFSNAIKANPKHAEVYQLQFCQSYIIIYRDMLSTFASLSQPNIAIIVWPPLFVFSWFSAGQTV